MKRANAKRKTRDVSNRRYNTRVVRFPNVKAFNDSVYGESDRLPFFKKKGFYVPVVYLSTLPNLQTSISSTLREIRDRRISKKRFLPALTSGISDGRFFNPFHNNSVVGSTFGGSTELTPRGVFFHHLGFSNPRKVLICVRRTVRKQVLHALGKTGKSGQKKPKWNDSSYIHC